MKGVGGMDAQQTELVRMLASFKLTVKKTLQKSVDLEALAKDVAYAKKCLAEVEDAAESVELLVLVMKLRELLVFNAPEPAPAAEDASKETRDYKFGARSW